MNAGELLRWKQQEWTLIAGAAAPLMAQGHDLFDALMKAQRLVLPRPRQRDKDSMQKLIARSKAPSGNGAVDHYMQAALKAYAKASAGQAPAAAPPVPPPPPADSAKVNVSAVHPKVLAASRQASRTQGNTIRWVPIEWAALAREVKRMQDAGDKRTLGRLINEAQSAVLVPNRWRKWANITQGDTSKINGRLLARGWADLNLLADDAPPEQVLEMVTHTQAPEPPPAPIAAPPVASAPHRATTPAAIAPRATFGFAMQAFAAQFEDALDTLLKAHAEHIYSTMDERLGRAAESIGAMVAKQITDGLRSTVVGIMTEELGGPVSPPPAPAPSTPPTPSLPPSASPSTPPVPVASASAPQEVRGPAAYEAERVASVPIVYKGQPRRAPSPDELEPVDPGDRGKLIVDIVGLKGVQPDEVRKAFNGHTSLRFVEADHIKGWVPRRGAHVVLDIKFISHDATLKCARYGIKPVQVRGGAGAVIHAIEALHQNEGVPV
jgi:hypothetical protein